MVPRGGYRFTGDLVPGGTKFMGYEITVADCFSPVKRYPGGTVSPVIWYQGVPNLRGYQITVTPVSQDILSPVYFIRGIEYSIRGMKYTKDRTSGVRIFYPRVNAERVRVNAHLS